MNQNNFQVKGEDYEAIFEPYSSPVYECQGCAFWKYNSNLEDMECFATSEVPPCSRWVREDGRAVVFMKVKK